MAHMSGFGGSVTVTAGPSTLVAAVQRWSVSQKTRNHEAYNMGQEWKETFVTASEWEATVECLIPVGITPATQLEVGQNIADLRLKFNATEYYEATGSGATGCFISGMSIDNPLDAPITAKMTITGKGALLPVTV